MKVLLVEELAGRERVPLLILKRRLESRGHEVRLSNSWRLEPDAKRFDPEVVVDNISDSPSHYLGKLSWQTKEHRNVNLNWEQTVDALNLQRYRYPRAMATHYVDARASWGKVFRDVLLAENPGLDPSRVHVTGSFKHAPNTMMKAVAREKIREMYDEDVGGFERVVLVAESFGAALIDPLKVRGPGPWPYPSWYEYVLRARIVRDAMVSLVRRLAVEEPSTLFLLRVHPTKDPSYRAMYSRLLELPNVRLNMRGEIGSLLRISDLLIASRSGALVDAHFQGVPAINLDSRANVLRHTHVFATVVGEFGAPTFAEDVEKMTVEDLIQRGRSAFVDPVLVEEWFGGAEPTAFDRLADVIEETAARPAVPKRARVPGLGGPWASAHPWARFVRNRIRYRFGIGGTPPADDPTLTRVAELVMGER